MADYNTNEVFFCGSCKRQQNPSKGTKCVHCGKETIIWNIDRISASDIQKRWQRERG